MTFPIDITIPNAPNDPADDQPKMKQNYANIAGFLSVNHVAAGSTGAGNHTFITFNNVVAQGALTTGQLSVEYPAVGIADPTKPSLYWKNSQGFFPLSAIRAFGRFNTQAPIGAPPFLLTPTSPPSTYNVVSISHQNPQVYIVNLATNATFGLNWTVLTTSSDGSSPSYVISANTLTITAQGTSGNTINFVILQI